MFHDILQAIVHAQRDPSQIPVVAQLAQQLVTLEDHEVDFLLAKLLDFGDDLRESLLDGEQSSPPHPIVPPTPTSPTSSTPGRSSAIGSSPLQPQMDQVFLPIIYQLVQREFLAPRPQRKQQLKEQGREVWADHSPVKESELMPDARAGSRTENGWSQNRLESVEMLYRLTPVGSELRNHLLHWLATGNHPAPLELWTDLICRDPPEHRLGIGLAFAPLVQAQDSPAQPMLDRLLNQATAHSQIAPAVFDLFNFYVRKGRLKQHPARPRLNQLAELLSQVCQQMARIEGGEFSQPIDANEINQKVSDSVALIVSLCDLFALTQHRPAIEPLHQALRLRHRRVQTEAAAALTRLQDQAGKQALVALAEQPVARLRVLAYAEELGFKQEISLELQGEIALAESKLAIWLSEPMQMGLAPSRLELIDHREMYWPSYERPVPCFLFQYSYGSGEQAHSNIGICGPLIHAFATDLRHLHVDEMYAAFAGWQTVHDEIFYMSPARAKQIFPNEIRRLEQGIEEEAFDHFKIQSVGSFFGELVLIATAECESQAGTLVIDGHDTTWFEIGSPNAPVDWKMAYGIWRGRQLLTRFNSTESM